MIDKNGVDRSGDWTYRPKTPGIPFKLAGNLNSATVIGCIMILERMEKEFKAGYFSKAEKESRLKAIRELRKELDMPELPSYNSNEFIKWVDS